MKTHDFYFDLPQELIAQTPVEPRDSSRLLVYHRDTGAVEHKIFRDVIDYLNPGDVLVIIAAISSAISLMEVVGAFAIDNAAKKGKQVDRTKVTLVVSGLILIEALLVAVDGLGSTGIFRWKASAMWNDCMLDFMDCWSEGVAMPIGAMLMSLMIGLELKPKFVLEEIGSAGGFFRRFYAFCITIVCPLVMALVTAGQFIDFFVGTDDGMDAQLICYAAAAALLVAFGVAAAVRPKKR